MNPEWRNEMSLFDKIVIGIVVGAIAIVIFAAGRYVGIIQTMNVVYKEQLNKSQEMMTAKISVQNALETSGQPVRSVPKKK
jgi:hypothetical protein